MGNQPVPVVPPELGQVIWRGRPSHCAQADRPRPPSPCGQVALGRYVQIQVTQDLRRRFATGFVAAEEATGRLAAFSTIVAASIQVPDLPLDRDYEAPALLSTPACPCASDGSPKLTFRRRGPSSRSAHRWLRTRCRPSPIPDRRSIWPSFCPLRRGWGFAGCR